MGIEIQLCLLVFAFALVALAAIGISNLIWWARCRWIDKKKDS